MPFLFSCSSSTDNEKIEEQNKKNEKWEKLNDLASHYGAVVGFDTLRFSLSYEYQNFLAKNNKILLNNFKIDDIVKVDSNYVVSISKGYYPKLFFELTCNMNQVELLLADTKSSSLRHYRSNGTIIVVAISSIKKVKFKIDTEVESCGSEDKEPEINIDLRTSDDFILKGQLIGISEK